MSSTKIVQKYFFDKVMGRQRLEPTHSMKHMLNNIVLDWQPDDARY